MRVTVDNTPFAKGAASRPSIVFDKSCRLVASITGGKPGRQLFHWSIATETSTLA
jgi:hypothetical protein